MSCGIYIITNKINGKVYIGQSVNIEARWEVEHLIRPNKHFDNAWKKYGADAFEFKILKECQREDLNELEFFYQCAYGSFDRRYGYNAIIGWTHGWKYINEEVKNGLRKHGMAGHIWTNEQRKTMSKSRKGKYTGDDHYFSKMTKEERKTFVKEKFKSFTSKWWNNGVEQKRSDTCPGEGWTHGQLQNKALSEQLKGMVFWNNGIINKRARECPGEGFVKGKLIQKNLHLLKIN